MSLLKNKNEFTFKWIIENYSLCNQKKGDFIKSSSFLVESVDHTRWFLNFFPKGATTSAVNYAACFLHREEDKSSKDKISIECEVVFSLVNGEIIGSFKEEDEFEKNFGRGILDAVKIESINEAMETCSEDILIISCRISKNKQLYEKATGCVCETKFGANKCNFLWNVKADYSSSNWKPKKVFTFIEVCAVEIALTCPNDSILISIQIQNDTNLLSKNISCMIALLDSSDGKYCSKRMSHLFESEEIWNFPSFFKKSELENHKDELIRNGAFSLMCYFSSPDNTKISRVKLYNYGSASSTDLKDCSTLHHDLKNTLLNKKQCDVQLRIGAQIFHAHKVILSSRSPVFAAMFERDMLENKTNVVDIEDTDADILKLFLDFMYSDSISNVDSTRALKLLLTADKYQVTFLKIKCSIYLGSTMCADNVCEILRVSDLTNSTLLKNAAINFLRDHSGDILPSTYWREWIKQNCEFGSEVLCKLSTDVGNKGINKSNK